MKDNQTLLFKDCLAIELCNIWISNQYSIDISEICLNKTIFG